VAYDSFPHSAVHIWFLVSTPGPCGTCNRCKTKINSNEINTRPPNGCFTSFFAWQNNLKQNENHTQPQTRCFLFACLFWIFYLARHLFYLFKFGSLSSICACNKLLLIEAQTGRENKSKMSIREEENQKTVPKMAGKIKWPRANRNSFICVCINFESCKLTHLAKPLFIIQIIYVQYLFSDFSPLFIWCQAPAAFSLIM